MTERFQCGDNAALVSYLYDECDPADREAISTHVSLCVACAAELAALQSARVHLESWTPPEGELGFRVVGARDSGSRAPTSLGVGPLGGSPGAQPPSGSWWRQPLPAWAQAAAACLLFATGLWLGIVRGSTPDALSMQTLSMQTLSRQAQSSGSMTDIATSGVELSETIGAASVSAVSASPASASGTSMPVAAASRADLEALERRLVAEITELRAETASAITAAPAGMSEAQMLARVRVLLDESEQRQQQELALRTAQVVRDVDSQRQVDLAQIQRNFGQIEGLTGAEVREQREILNYLMRVSEQR